MNAYSAELCLSSKNIHIDQINEIISADGGVDIIQEVKPGKKRELHCEKIEYNRKTGEIKLFGESVIKEYTGEVFKARDMQLDDKFKKAVIKAMLLVLNDNSKVRASIGKKADTIYTFEKASYTPCNETECSTPLWDLFADKIIYNSKKKTFTYYKVRLRFKGQTIFYTPYFTHPSFEVRRQTGFVTPILSLNNNTGVMIGVPYFITLGRYQDLKLTPFINSQRRGCLASEYRRAFDRGDLNINASVLSRSTSKKAAEEDKKTRWHVSTFFQTRNMDNRRITFKANRASDVTYTSKYPVSPAKSSNFIQRKCYETKMAFDFFDKNYFVTVDSHMFQTPQQSTSPVLLPHINANYSQPAGFGGMIGFGSDTIFLSRNEQISPLVVKQMFRSSNKINWVKTTPIHGVALDIDCGLKTEICSINSDDTKQNKVMPILENQVSAFYPIFSKISSKQTSIWGPKIVFSSTELIGRKKGSVDNEDSIFSSFDDLNLYSLNRYGSYGKSEDGEKISTGVENSIYKSSRRYLNFFIGNSQQLGNKNKDSGKYGNAIVGRFLIKPSENVSLRTRFVGFPCCQKIRMIESGVNLKANKFLLGCGHVYDSRTNEFRSDVISQVGLTLGYKLTKYWKISYSSIYNLKKKLGDKNLLRGLFATYEDECFRVDFGFYRSSYKDHDIKKDHGIVLSVGFKNLGALGKPSDKYLYRSSIANIE